MSPVHAYGYSVTKAILKRRTVMSQLLLWLVSALSSSLDIGVRIDPDGLS
jgi:hypothetical protein